jgi:long-chain acyl-CoA synthetase
MFGMDYPPNGSVLSYLPLAHIYEVCLVLLTSSSTLTSLQRVVELTTLAIGGCIGFSTGDNLRLLEDAQMLKPHFFPAVPRVLNRVYQSAMAAGNVPGLKGALFRTAVRAKLDQYHATGVSTHPFWDALVFRKVCFHCLSYIPSYNSIFHSKVRAVLGGNLLLVSTGSAPISAEVIDFLKIALVCEITEGTVGHISLSVVT